MVARQNPCRPGPGGCELRPACPNPGESCTKVWTAGEPECRCGWRERDFARNLRSAGLRFFQNVKNRLVWSDVIQERPRGPVRKGHGSGWMMMRALRRVFGSELELLRRYLFRGKRPPSTRRSSRSSPHKPSGGVGAAARHRCRSAKGPATATKTVDHAARQIGVAEGSLRDAYRYIRERRGALSAGGLSVLFHVGLALVLWEAPLFSSR